MTAKQLPPIDLLRERLSYDPETGAIVWIKPPSKNHPHLVGQEAGIIHWSGYRLLTFQRRIYTAARIAWALFHGEDPHPYDIDHINRDKLDNRISNLRKVTRQINNQNRNPHTLVNAHSRKSIKITYPDGRGSIIVDSGRTAARILNISPSTVSQIAKREDNQLYWGKNMHTFQASGIRLDFLGG